MSWFNPFTRKAKPEPVSICSACGKEIVGRVVDHYYKCRAPIEESQLAYNTFYRENLGSSKVWECPIDRQGYASQMVHDAICAHCSPYDPPRAEPITCKTCGFDYQNGKHHVYPSLQPMRKNPYSPVEVQCEACHQMHLGIHECSAAEAQGGDSLRRKFYLDRVAAGRAIPKPTWEELPVGEPF